MCLLIKRPTLTYKDFWATRLQTWSCQTFFNTYVLICCRKWNKLFYLHSKPEAQIDHWQIYQYHMTFFCFWTFPNCCHEGPAQRINKIVRTRRLQCSDTTPYFSHSSLPVNNDWLVYLRSRWEVLKSSNE